MDSSRSWLESRLITTWDISLTGVKHYPVKVEDVGSIPVYPADVGIV